MKAIGLLSLLLLISISCGKSGSTIDWPEPATPPTRVLIKSLTISGLRDSTWQGTLWDTDGSVADPFFKLVDGTEDPPRRLWLTDPIFNADPNRSHTFTPDSVIIIENPTQYYRWEIQDRDNNFITGDDPMSSNVIRFFNKYEGPDTDTIKLPLYLSWIRLAFAVEYQY